MLRNSIAYCLTTVRWFAAAKERQRPPPLPIDIVNSKGLLFPASFDSNDYDNSGNSKGVIYEVLRMLVLEASVRGVTDWGGSCCWGVGLLYSSIRRGGMEPVVPEVPVQSLQAMPLVVS